MIFESHLLSMVVYAFFVALVLALIRREDNKARLRYGLVLFAVMTVGALVFGWFMFLFIKR
jgi:predicted branched-subunit amino acid permease